MTIKEKLKRCLLTYPGIFSNKWEVYNYWFIVNDNGLEWFKGELVDLYNKKLSIIDIQSSIANLQKKYLKEDNLLGILPDYHIDEFTRLAKQVIHWEHNSTIFTNNRSIYSICEYAKILNIPINIKSDWLEACKEMYNWLIDNLCYLSEEDKIYLPKIASKLKITN